MKTFTQKEAEDICFAMQKQMFYLNETVPVLVVENNLQAWNVACLLGNNIIKYSEQITLDEYKKLIEIHQPELGVNILKPGYTGEEPEEMWENYDNDVRMKELSEEELNKYKLWKESSRKLGWIYCMDYVWIVAQKENK